VEAPLILTFEQLNVMTSARGKWLRWSDLGEWFLIMLMNLVNSWLC